MKHAHEIHLMRQGMGAGSLCVFHQQFFLVFELHQLLGYEQFQNHPQIR